MLDLWSWKWAQCFSKGPHEKGTFDKFLWYTLVFEKGISDYFDFYQV